MDCFHIWYTPLGVKVSQPFENGQGRVISLGVGGQKHLSGVKLQQPITIGHVRVIALGGGATYQILILSTFSIFVLQ
jgi:hypothetical protein